MRIHTIDPVARRLIATRIVSAVGDSLFAAPLLIWVEALTHSPSRLAEAATLYAAGPVIGLVTGMLPDRFEARRVLQVSMTLSATAMIPLLLVRAKSDFALIGLGAFFLGISTSAHPACLGSLTRGAAATPDKVAIINARLQVARSVIRITAPLVGAGIFAAAGIKPVIALDMASFVLAAYLARSLPTTSAPAAASASVASFRHELVGGLVAVIRSPELRRMAGVAFASMTAVGFLDVLLLPMIVNALHRAPSFYGLVSAVQGCAALGGAALAGGLLRRTGASRAAALGIFVLALMFGAFGTTTIIGLFVGIAAGGLGLSWLLPAILTAPQTIPPREVQGRVSSLFEFALTAPGLIAPALADVLYHAAGLRAAFSVGGGVLLASTAFLARSRRCPTGLSRAIEIAPGRTRDAR